MKFDKFESILNKQGGVLTLLSSRNLSEYQITVLIGTILAHDDRNLIRLLLNNNHIRLSDSHYITIIRIIAIEIMAREKINGFKTGVFSDAFMMLSPIRRIRDIGLLVDFYSQLTEEQRGTEASLWIFHQILSRINVFYKKRR